MFTDYLRINFGLVRRPGFVILNPLLPSFLPLKKQFRAGRLSEGKGLGHWLRVSSVNGTVELVAFLRDPH
jgi:hypothetical protein